MWVWKRRSTPRGSSACSIAISTYCGSEKKFVTTWIVSTSVGFYSVFVLMEMWNWFAVPLLGVSECSYWLMYGVSMLFGLMTGASDGEKENPVDERRWNALFIALDTCVPEHKTEEVREEVRSETEGIWTDVGIMILRRVLPRPRWEPVRPLVREPRDFSQVRRRGGIQRALRSKRAIHPNTSARHAPGAQRRKGSVHASSILLQIISIAEPVVPRRRPRHGAGRQRPPESPGGSRGN